jgi:colicin import membrane protein
MGKGRENREEVLWDIHESSEIVPLEFTEEIKPEIFGLEITKAQEMTSGLSTTLAEREVLKNAYADVIGLEITTETLPVFKELRLKIVKNRTQGIEKWHKANKAFYLAGGRFVDAVKNKEVAVNEDMESKLLEAEKFFENQEKEKARLLNLDRIEKIRPYVQDADGMNFSEFDDESFDDFVLGKKTRFENEKKAQEAENKRIEEERLAEIERQRAIKAENEKLKQEAEKARLEAEKLAKIEAEKQAKIQAQLEKERLEAKAKQEEIEAKAREEKSKQEAILKAEREAKEKLEAELKAKKEAEIKAEKERKEADEKARQEAEKLAKAPIKEQLNIWVDNFSIEIPDEKLMNNETASLIKNKFEAFKTWAKKQIEEV